MTTHIKHYLFPILGAAFVVIVLALDLLAGGADEEVVDARDAPQRESSRDAILERAAAFYESRAYYERPRPHSEVPEGLPDIKAETCKACHSAIYEEWAISTHRRAWEDDAQFMEELAKSRGERDDSSGDVGWLCVNCHTPNYQQLEELVVGLEGGKIDAPIYVQNPEFDRDLQLEAITCATCHVKDGVIYGPYGDTNAPHPTRKGEHLLSEQICTSCHQAEARYVVENLGCFFSTGEEWRQSPYAARGETCQSCHMPEVERAVADTAGSSIRKTRRHWFGGSLIPKKPEFAAELEPLREVYGSGVTFDVARAPADARVTPAPDVEGLPESFGCEPEAAGEDRGCVLLAVTITNARAGHYMPTGDPERHIEVEAIARRSDEVIARGVDLIGSRYEWWPEIRLIEDTRIPPMESRVLIVAVPVRGEPATLELIAHKQRMYEGAFEHHELEGRYVRGRRFHRSTWAIDAQGNAALVKQESDRSSHP